MRRIALWLLALVIAFTGTAALVSVSPSASAGDKIRTPFGLRANGYGIKMKGGELPANVGPLAQAIIGCTNVAGLRHNNGTATVQLPGLGRVEGMKTATRTVKSGKTVTSYSQHDVARIVLVENVLGRIAIEGIRSTSRAWHDDKGFHAEATTKVLSLTYDPPGDLPPQQLDLPEVGQPVTIPGVATISIGIKRRRVFRDSAKAVAQALVINLHATNSVVQVARTAAEIGGGVRHGIFRGTAYGTRAQVLGDVVGVGKTPKIVMPCRGTKGKIQKISVASVGVPGVADVDAVGVSQWSRATRRAARAWEQAKIAGVSLLGGAVEIKGITARVNVLRRGKILRRNVQGTQTAEIVVNGEAVTVPPIGVLEVPGLVKIEEKVVKRISGGIQVIALRVTLLDGSGAVIELGVAKVAIGKAAR